MQNLDKQSVFSEGTLEELRKIFKELFDKDLEDDELEETATKVVQFVCLKEMRKFE